MGRYEEALHGLMCEQLPLRATIEEDVFEWLSLRAAVRQGEGEGGGLTCGP